MLFNFELHYKNGKDEEKNPVVLKRKQSNLSADAESRELCLLSTEIGASGAFIFNILSRNVQRELLGHALLTSFYKLLEPKYSWKAVVCCNCLVFRLRLFLCGGNITICLKMGKTGNALRR